MSKTKQRKKVSRHCPLCEAKHPLGEHLPKRKMENGWDQIPPTVGSIEKDRVIVPTFPTLDEGVHSGHLPKRENNLSGGVESRHAENDNIPEAHPVKSGADSHGQPEGSETRRSGSSDPPAQESLGSPLNAELKRSGKGIHRPPHAAPPAQESLFQERGDVKCSPGITDTILPAIAGTVSVVASNRSANVQAGNGATIPQLEPGVYERLSPDIYHRQNSFSRADMLLAAVPAKLKWHKDHPEIEKVTPAKIIGSAFHTRLLEPEVFNARYTLSRYEEYRTTEAKNWRDEQTQKGLVVLDAEDIAMIDEMVMACREHPHFSQVFRRAGMRRELTVVARDPATGLLLRARYDIVPGGNVIPDIKSTIDASAEGFGKQVWNLNYGAQCSHYRYVWNLAHPHAKHKKEHFIFLVQEKEPPYLTAMYLAPSSLIEYWDRILRARRYVIAQCIATGSWPSYEVQPLNRSEFTLPRYAIKDIQDSEQNG